MIDSFDGKITQKFTGYYAVPPGRELASDNRIEAGFSPDSKYVLCGSNNPNQNVFIWNIETGKEVKLINFHP